MGKLLASATIVVDPTGKGHVRTIAQAVAALPAAGGHIYLAKGTHTLTTTVSFSSLSNITIEGSMASIVDVTSIGAGHGFRLNGCSNITMRGFKMLRTGSLGGYGFIGFISTNSGHKFIDLNFSATSHAAVYAECNGATSDILIKGCTFNVGTNAVYFAALGDSVNQVRIEGNYFGPSNGVKLDGQASGIIGNVTIFNNSFVSCTNGIEAYDYVDNLTVDANSFSSCTTGVNIGTEANNAAITGNTFQGGTNGVSVGSSAVRYVVISGNTFRSQTGYSILITSGVYGTITGNSLSSTAGGINLSGATYYTVVGNSIISVTSNTPAIYVQGANNLISGNYLYSLSGKGIDINNVADVTVENNVISSTFSYAIYAHGAARAALTGNKLYVAGDHGMLIDTCAGSVVTANLVYASQGGSNGIYLTSSSNSVISANLLASNTNNGILVNASSLVLVDGNTCLSNSAVGIKLTNGDNCDVVSNLCSANGTYGIDEDSASTGNNYSGNRLAANTSGRFNRTAGKILYQDGMGSIKTTGSTGDAYATIFDMATDHAGLAGCFRITNTDGANTLTYQVTFTGMDASSQAVSADLAPAAFVLFNTHTDQSSGLAPFKEIKVELKSKVASTPATYAVYAALAGAEV